MVQVILFVIRGVSSIINLMINVEMPLTANTSIKLYWIFVFVFLMAMFIKLMRTVLNVSVSDSGKGK